MAKGQKKIQEDAQRRSAAEYQEFKDSRTRLLNNEMAAERRNLIKNRKAAIDTGTIGDMKDFRSNRANVAERKRQRDARVNLTKTGIAGLASNYADPTQVALAAKMNDDEFARDSAGQTEADANAYIAETRAMEDQMIQYDAGNEYAIMGHSRADSMDNIRLAAQIASTRASVVPSIIGAAIQGVAGIATHGNWFQRRPSGST